MPLIRQKKRVRVQSFNAGENSTAEPGIVKSPFASLAQNVNLDEAGKVKQRIGVDEVGDSPDTLKMDMNFSTSSAVDDEGNIIAASITETSTAYDDGKFAKAIQFNGTTSSVLVAATETEVSVNTMGPFVITAWVYVDTDGGSDQGRIVDKYATGGYRFWVHTESSSTVKLSFEVDYVTTNALAVTSTTMSTGAWHKVEAVLATHTPEIYIDGAEASYGTQTDGVGGAVDDSAVPLYIGSDGTSTYYFDGAMEQVRIYDGARTSIEYEQKKIMALTRYHVGSTIDTLVRVRNKHLEELDSDQKGWTRLNASDGFEATTANKETNFVQALDKLFILNGEDNVHSMASNKDITDELDTNVDPPITTVGAWAQNNRLFLSGSLTDSERDFVWFSNTLAPQTFGRATNVFKVRSGTSGKVTWLEPFKLNELIIYKSDSIFVLNMTGTTPLTDWTLQPLNTEVGCAAGKSVQSVGDDHIFLDNEGKVRLLSRTTFDKLQTAVISSPIQTILDTINIDAISTVTSALIDGKYYLSFPSGTATEPDRTIIWDSAAARLAKDPEVGWSTVPEDIWYAKCFAPFEFGDNELRLVHGDSRAINTVYKHKGNSDAGKTIDMSVAGPAHDFGNRDTDKIWGPLHFVWVAGEATTAEMFANIDEGGFESLGTLSLTGGAPVLPIALEFSLGGSSRATQMFHVKQIGRGKTCRIKAQHNQNNSTATFIEYTLYARERIPRITE